MFGDGTAFSGMRNRPGSGCLIRYLTILLVVNMKKVSIKSV